MDVITKMLGKGVFKLVAITKDGQTGRDNSGQRGGARFDPDQRDSLLKALPIQQKPAWLAELYWAVTEAD